MIMCAKYDGHWENKVQYVYGKIFYGNIKENKNMKNNDRKILESLITKYGKSGVNLAINRLNENTEEIKNDNYMIIDNLLFYLKNNINYNNYNNCRYKFYLGNDWYFLLDIESKYTVYGYLIKNNKIFNISGVSYCDDSENNRVEEALNFIIDRITSSDNFYYNFFGYFLYDDYSDPYKDRLISDKKFNNIYNINLT